MKPATPNDVPQLVALMEESYAESSFPLNRQRATEAFANLLADDRLGQVWLIQSGDQAIGYVVLTLCYSMEYGGRSAFVDDLFVRPSFRNAGLAAAALAEVKAVCAGRGIRAIHVETGGENGAAHAVYRRAGFTETDRQLLALKLASPTHEN